MNKTTILSRSYKVFEEQQQERQRPWNIKKMDIFPGFASCQMFVAAVLLSCSGCAVVLLLRYHRYSSLLTAVCGTLSAGCWLWLSGCLVVAGGSQNTLSTTVVLPAVWPTTVAIARTTTSQQSVSHQ